MANLADEKISVSLVARTIGRASLDVGTLCTNDSITKWSWRKPIHFANTFTPLTDQNIIDGHHGLNVHSKTLGAFAPDPFPLTGNSDSDGLDGTVLDDVRKSIAWKYETVEKGNENWGAVYGRPNLDNPDSEGNYSPARLSDFAGYDHAAKPIFYSDEGLIDADGKFEITVKTTLSSDTYGGITVSNYFPNGGYAGTVNLGKNYLTDTGVYLQIFMVTKEAVDNPTSLGGGQAYRYAIGFKPGYRSDRIKIDSTTTEYKFNLYQSGFNELLGDFYIFVAIVVGDTTYALTEKYLDDGYDDSWEGFAGKLFYPKLTNTATAYCFPIEGLIYEVNYPDGTGNIIMYDSSFGKILLEDGTYEDAKFSYVSDYGNTSIADYVTFKYNDSKGYIDGFGLIVTSETFDICKSNKRCVSFFVKLTSDSLTSHNAYFNLNTNLLGLSPKEVDENSGYDYGTTVWYKPLITGVPMYNTSYGALYTASFMLKFFADSNGYDRSVVVMRCYDASTGSFALEKTYGQPTSTEYLWGYNGKTNMVWRYINIGNEVSVRNQIKTSNLVLAVDAIYNTSMDSVSTYTYDLTVTINSAEYRPIIPTNVLSSGDVSYGDLSFKLPEDMQGKSSDNGGKCHIKYIVGNYNHNPLV